MSLTTQQLAERQTGIGGSEAAIVLGLSKWKTAAELYHEKRSAIPVAYTENDQQRWGRLLEGAIKQEYAERTKRIVRQPAGTIRHPVHDFLVGHPDGVTECGRLVEAKTVVPQLAHLWGDIDSDIVPQDYLLQCQHYMILLDLKVADLVPLLGRFDFRIYQIEADRELQEMMIEASRDFMRRVREGDPPPLDYQHRTAIDVVKKIYPGTSGARLIANEQAIEWRTAMEIAAAAEKAAAAEVKANKARLLELMGESALLAFPDGKALRRQRIDKDEYTVAPSSYIDTRFIKDPGVTSK